MNTICPYCGESLRFPVDWMDCMVACNHCGRQFLLRNRPRDQAPLQGRSLSAVQTSIDAAFWTIVIVGLILLHIAMFFI